MATKAIRPDSELVDFHPCKKPVSWGILETKCARIGVLYREDPAPQLEFAPPVRVPEHQADAFLERLLDAFGRTGEELFTDIGCDPRDGEVSLVLTPAARADVDVEIARAKAFFDQHFPALAETCVTVEEPAEEGDDVEEGEGFDDDDEDEDALLAALLRGIVV